jgi:CubicO group peptidase (beta-lactamase class C family)
MRDSLENWLVSSNLLKKFSGIYHYSDLGFMILHQVVEAVTGQSIDQYVYEQYYQPLGLERTVFNPLSNGFEIYETAPTEYDDHLRDEQVWGNVHDRNAAVFGGVAGHAGLFSNTRDLAVILQMMLQGGHYGGKQFLNPQTLDTFNSRYYIKNRRGLGWDKPGRYNPQISALASPSSFGHSGFTGTMVWADPEYDLIYVFLSNRIFPNADNQKLNNLDIRKRIHTLIYKSINAY